MTWHINQNPLWGKRQEEKKKEILTCKDSLVIRILTPLLPALFPFQSLYRHTSMRVQIMENASTGEQQQKRGKWNILHYHQGSPFVWSLLLYLLSQALHNYSPCSPESAHAWKCALAHAYTRRKNKKQRKKQNTEKGEKKQDLGCLWVCFTPTLFCFALPPPPRFPRWQGTGRLEQQSECDVTLCWGLYSARLLLICKLT